MKIQICLGTAGVMLVKHLIGNAQLRALPQDDPVDHVLRPSEDKIANLVRAEIKMPDSMLIQRP